MHSQITIMNSVQNTKIKYLRTWKTNEGKAETGRILVLKEKNTLIEIYVHRRSAVKSAY